MQPDLNLIYNSQANNGWVGVGWDLSLGSIHRSTQNGFPTYNDTTDTFIFNFQGQSEQLVQISTGSDTYGSYYEYRSQIESAFMRIRYYPPSQWRVWSKDGGQYYFQGLGLNASNNEYTYWGLSASTDTLGNYMQVTYQTVGSNLSYLPTEIDYTGNASQGVAPTDQILFSFQSRPDILTSFASAYGQQITQRLSAIQENVNGALVRTYTLNYSTSNSSGYSLLSSITLTGSDGVSSLPATTFSYSDASGFQFSSWNSSSITNPASYGVLAAGDFNGDKITDLFYYPEGQSGDYNLYVGISNGATALNYTSWGTANTGINPGYILISDLNGDGYDDVYTSDEVTDYLELSNGSSFTQHTGTDNSIFFRDVVGGGNFIGSLNGSFAGYQYQSGLIGTYVGYVNWNCTPPCSIYDIEYPRWDTTQFGPFGVRTWDVGDFNGDSLTDVLSLWANTPLYLRVGLNQGSSFSYGVWSGALNHTDYSTIAETLRVGDFNGDGLSDVAYYDGGQIYVGVSTGTAFSFSSWATVTLSTTAIATLRVGDFNGDGLTDIAYFDGNHTTWVGLSNGAQFNITAWDTAQVFPGTSTINSFVVGDFNGDGKSDIAVVSQNLQSWVGLSSGPAVNLLTQVNNPLGGTVAVQYESAYSTGTITNVPFPIQIVRSVTTSDGMGDTIISSYSYSGGLYQATPWKQREFLGFQQVTQTDAQGNYVVNHFLQNDGAMTSAPDLDKRSIISKDSRPCRNPSLRTRKDGVCYRYADEGSHLVSV